MLRRTLLFAMLALPLFVIQPAQAEYVTPGDTSTWFNYVEGSGPAPEYEFTEDGIEASISAADSKLYAVFMEPGGVQLDEITQMSVTTTQTAGPNNWYVDVFVDPECDGSGVLESEWDFAVPNNSSKTTVDLYNTKGWYRQGNSSTKYTWPEVVNQEPDTACLDAYPYDDDFNAPVLWQLGDSKDGWVGYEGTFNSFTFNGTTYNFIDEIPEGEKPTPPSLNDWNVTADESRAYAYNVDDSVYSEVLMDDNSWETTSGRIPQNLIDYGVKLAVDIWELNGDQAFDNYQKVCLQGEGRLIFLDATTAPRQQVEIKPVSTETDDGNTYTCGWIPNAGTVVLIPPEPTN